MVKLYPPERRSGYEELLSYYPRYYWEVFEMQAILKYFGCLCDELEKQTEQAFLNYFLKEADEETCQHWEDVLNIPYTEGRSLEERRAVILGKLCSRDHIGEPEIRDTIAAYTPNEVWVDFDLGIIYIIIQGEVFDEMSLIKTLYEKVPAHLKIDMKIEIKRSFVNDLPVGQGGAIGALFDFTPFDVYRKERKELPVGMVARMPSDIQGIPAFEKKVVKSSQSSSSIGFFQTRVKGKLVG